MSATKPPNRQSMKEVPRKLVTVLAEVALPKCMVPVKYVTKFTAIPNVVSLSNSSTPEMLKIPYVFQKKKEDGLKKLITNRK